MTRRERLMATLRGEPVDRPAVSFYEIGGFAINRDDPDQYNIYNAPTWQPLLDLAFQHTDIIRMVSPVRAQSHLSWAGSDTADIRKKYVEEKTWEEDGSRYTRLTYKIASRALTMLSRRDREIDTVWVLEPLLKNAEDAELYLQLPDEIFAEVMNIDRLKDEEARLGESGIVMVDTEDPVCAVAGLFDMETFPVFALTEQTLCHKLLEKHAAVIQHRTEFAAREFPGRLWRIYGPEYVTEPFLPSYLFDEYVVKYTGPMVKEIKAHGGFARIHAHGRIRNVLDQIACMGADAIDPIEPPPHGDVELKFVREQYGKQMVLFGNLEITDLENLPPEKFRQVVRRSVAEGTTGAGRGFVLMTSASPYGREITDRTFCNYQTMLEEVERANLPDF
jgi:hypothetical protein